MLFKNFMQIYFEKVHYILHTQLPLLVAGFLPAY